MASAIEILYSTEWLSFVFTQRKAINKMNIMESEAQRRGNHARRKQTTI